MLRQANKNESLMLADAWTKSISLGRKLLLLIRECMEEEQHRNCVTFRVLRGDFILASIQIKLKVLVLDIHKRLKVKCKAKNTFPRYLTNQCLNIQTRDLVLSFLIIVNLFVYTGQKHVH